MAGKMRTVALPPAMTRPGSPFVALRTNHEASRASYVTRTSQ